MSNPLVGMTPSGPETDGWEPPVPLGTPKLPPFPDGVLPGWLDAYVSAISTALQVSRDFAAMIALGAVSACVAGKAKIELTPGYREPLNLWIVAAMVSAAGKSATVRMVTAPIAAWEATQAEAMRDEISEAMSRLRIREGALQKAERAAATAENHERLRAESEAMAIAREVAAVHVPVVPRILADDATAERIATLLMEHDGRLAIISPEGDVFDLMGGRYSNNIPNIGVYLRAHAGDTIRVDRQGRPPDFVPDPSLTLAISPQPDVLRGLTDKPGFRGRGLLARPLYCLPETLIGRRNWDVADAAPIRGDLADAYHRRLADLLSMPYDHAADGARRPHTIAVAPDALAAWKAFRGGIEPRLATRGDLGALPDWGGKLWGAAARLAGVLHLALHGSCADLAGIPPISLPTMEAALALARYCIPHARAAFAQMGSDTTRDQAADILGWIERRADGKDARAPFSKRECWQGVRRRFERPDELDAPLQRLCDHGYIRPKADPDGMHGRGRPASPQFEVNPFRAPQPADHDESAAILCTPTTISVSPSVHKNPAAVHENPSHSGAVEGQLPSHDADGAENSSFSANSSIFVNSVYGLEPSEHDGDAATGDDEGVPPESVHKIHKNPPTEDTTDDDDCI